MIESLIVRTPLLPFWEPKLAANVYLKAENLQCFGSYKIRGVAAAISKCAPQNLVNGLSTVSAGNLAQAVAFAAQILKIPCKVFVPENAPQIKKNAIKAFGADLIELPFDKIWDLVKNGLIQRDGELFIHPLQTPGILEGYGNIATEILADCPAADALIIPFGLGGLSLGISRVMKQIKPQMDIYLCEPETASPFHYALRTGRPTRIERQSSFVDAIGTPEVLPEVFKELRSLVVDSLVLSNHEAKLAVSRALFGQKLLCEGAAAVSLAAAIRLANSKDYKNIVCIISGGNLSPEVLREILIDQKES